MKCGDVLLVLFPFTDDSGSKVRPALVVSNDLFNNGDDLILVPISHVPDPEDRYVYPIEKAHSAFPASGLKMDSFVKWTKPMALARCLMRRRIGSIEPRTLSEIRNLIVSVFN